MFLLLSLCVDTDIMVITLGVGEELTTAWVFKPRRQNLKKSLIIVRMIPGYKVYHYTTDLNFTFTCLFSNFFLVSFLYFTVSSRNKGTSTPLTCSFAFRSKLIKNTIYPWLQHRKTIGFGIV